MSTGAELEAEAGMGIGSVDQWSRIKGGVVTVVGEIFNLIANSRVIPSTTAQQHYA